MHTKHDGVRARVRQSLPFGLDMLVPGEKEERVVIGLAANLHTALTKVEDFSSQRLVLPPEQGSRSDTTAVERKVQGTPSKEYMPMESFAQAEHDEVRACGGHSSFRGSRHRVVTGSPRKKVSGGKRKCSEATFFLRGAPPNFAS